jgi:hypothetical protein
MKRSLTAALIYLPIAGGIAVGHFANTPYKGNSTAVFEVAGAGMGPGNPE